MVWARTQLNGDVGDVSFRIWQSAEILPDQCISQWAERTQREQRAQRKPPVLSAFSAPSAPSTAWFGSTGPFSRQILNGGLAT